jgi:hypothetical protein
MNSRGSQKALNQKTKRKHEKLLNKSLASETRFLRFYVFVCIAGCNLQLSSQTQKNKKQMSKIKQVESFSVFLGGL